MASPVTDPDLIAQLEGSKGPQVVADPELLKQLDAPPPSVAEDVLGGLQGGIIRGAASLPGLPSAALNLTKALADGINHQTVGRLYNLLAPGGTGDLSADTRPSHPMDSDALGIAPEKVLPTPAQTTRAVEGVIGDTYQPQTVPGQLSASVGGFLGSGAMPVQALAGGLGSEAAGYLTKGSPAEPYARAAAAMLAPAAAGRAITPIRTDPARIPLVDTLEAEGIPLSAGQRTGSKPLQWAESALSDVPGSGAPAHRLMEEQGQAFNAAAARRMGEPDAELLTPDVMASSANRLGQGFNDIAARNTLVYDPQMGQDIADTIGRYHNTLDSLQRPVFSNLVQDIQNRVIQGQGTMPGNVYQAARSDLSAIAAENPGSRFGRAVAGLRDALDGAMQRSVSPADAQAWQDLRTQYGNMKVLEKAMSGAGERTAQGYLSPLALRTAVANNNPQAYVRGEGDLNDLARAGAGVMAPLPQSGTAPRHHVANLASLLGAGVGSVAGASHGAAGSAEGFIAGAAAPAVLARALMSRPVQSYLGNRVIQGGEDGRAVLVRGLLGFGGT